MLCAAGRSRARPRTCIRVPASRLECRERGDASSTCRGVIAASASAGRNCRDDSKARIGERSARITRVLPPAVFCDALETAGLGPRFPTAALAENFPMRRKPDPDRPDAAGVAVNRRGLRPAASRTAPARRSVIAFPSAQHECAFAPAADKVGAVAVVVIGRRVTTGALDSRRSTIARPPRRRVCAPQACRGGSSCLNVDQRGAWAMSSGAAIRCATACGERGEFRIPGCGEDSRRVAGRLRIATSSAGAGRDPVPTYRLSRNRGYPPVSGNWTRVRTEVRVG